MHDLNYQLKQLCARNRDGSYSTQANRQRILDLVARQLNAMDFRRMSTHSLKPNLILIGLIANTCIESTARFAVELGYHVTLVRDATAATSTKGDPPALPGDQNGIVLKLIQPGKPTQNAYIESFNGKLRDECLNEHWFLSLDDARQIVGNWRRDYNEQRPHSSLGYMTPSEFAAQCREGGSTETLHLNYD